MTSRRSGRRSEQLALAKSLRAQGESWWAIAGVLREQYDVNARVAMRLAHGWGQSDAADAWNQLWPDDPKTFKNFSYWENWPSRAGYAPSLAILTRLAELYECDAADLLTDVGQHRSEGGRPSLDGRAALEGDVLAWQVEHLGSAELVEALMEWSNRLPAADRRSLLLKLSAATATAANDSDSASADMVVGAAPSLDELAGAWDSRYAFTSTGRAADFSYSHQIDLRAERGKLVGKSSPSGTGTVELELGLNGLLVAGTWTERTAQGGYYRGAVYHGILQLVLDPTGRSMDGLWMGPDKHFVINSGPWTLTRSEADAPGAS